MHACFLDSSPSHSLFLAEIAGIAYIAKTYIYLAHIPNRETSHSCGHMHTLCMDSQIHLPTSVRASRAMERSLYRFVSLSSIFLAPIAPIACIAYTISPSPPCSPFHSYKCPAHIHINNDNDFGFLYSRATRTHHDARDALHLGASHASRETHLTFSKEYLIIIIITSWLQSLTSLILFINPPPRHIPLYSHSRIFLIQYPTVISDLSSQSNSRLCMMQETVCISMRATRDK